MFLKSGKNNNTVAFDGASNMTCWKAMYYYLRTLKKKWQLTLQYSQNKNKQAWANCDANPELDWINTACRTYKKYIYTYAVISVVADHSVVKVTKWIVHIRHIDRQQATVRRDRGMCGNNCGDKKIRPSNGVLDASSRWDNSRRCSIWCIRTISTLEILIFSLKLNRHGEPNNALLKLAQT